jgi:hypothetical protein
MFGRPSPPTSAPASTPGNASRGGRPQRSIPPGLVPFVPVIAIVVILIAALITPWLAVALIVVGVAQIVRMRYRDVKDVDYATLRRNDPWARAWDTFRRGRTDLDDRNR